MSTHFLNLILAILILTYIICYIIIIIATHDLCNNQNKKKTDRTLPKQYFLVRYY